MYPSPAETLESAVQVLHNETSSRNSICVQEFGGFITSPEQLHQITKKAMSEPILLINSIRSLIILTISRLINYLHI